MRPAAQVQRWPARSLLVGVLLALVASHAIPFWWGLPAVGQHAWAFDEISPSHSGDEVLDRHGGRYPPLHYWLLKAAYSPVRLADASGLVDFQPGQRATWLRSSGRLLTVLMAAVTMWLLVRLARRLFPRIHGTGPLLAWLVGLSPVYVFYAKMVNLDVPYLFWFVASLLAYVRILEGHALRDYLAFGLLAAAAICTKDQAYALYVLPSIWLPFALARWRDDRPGFRGALQALIDRRMVLGALAGAAAFLIVHNVLVDPSELREHLRVMLGKGSQPNRGFFEHTVAGHGAMAWLAIRHVAFILGLPACLAAAYGLWLAWRQRMTRALVLLLFPISSYLFFIVPVLFHRDRYLLPAGFVLACFAALGLATFVSAPTWRRGRYLVVGLVLVHVLARGWLINLAMLNDSRYDAERWIQARRSAGDSVVVLNNQAPRGPRTTGRRSLGRLKSDGPRWLRRSNADYLMISPEEAEDRNATAELDRLYDGSYGYRVDRTFQWRPTWNLLPLWRLSSNLPKINPSWVVFRRRAEMIDDSEARAQLEGLWRGELEDWAALGRKLLASPLLRDRRRLAPDLWAFNLGADGWTRGTQPALLVFANTSDTTRAARVLLRTGPREDESAVALIRGDGLDRRLVLEGNQELLDLASLTPGDTLTAAIAAERPLEVTDRGRTLVLGVRILPAERPYR